MNFPNFVFLSSSRKFRCSYFPTSKISQRRRSALSKCVLWPARKKSKSNSADLTNEFPKYFIYPVPYISKLSIHSSKLLIFDKLLGEHTHPSFISPPWRSWKKTIYFCSCFCRCSNSLILNWVIWYSKYYWYSLILFKFKLSMFKSNSYIGTSRGSSSSSTFLVFSLFYLFSFCMFVLCWLHNLFSIKRRSLRAQ